MQILYRDQTLLVLNKPSGLLAVPGRGRDKQDSLATRVQARYADALVVHRLDMATSGIMLMARGPAMQRELSRLFAQRRIHKQYVALVHGRLREPRGIIDVPLGADWPNRPRQKVDFAQGKPSLTAYRVLHYDALNDRSRVLLHPITGRSHQLRLHMQYLGHPVLGDALYAPQAATLMPLRLMLHATELVLPHPLDGHMYNFTCATPF